MMKNEKKFFEEPRLEMISINRKDIYTEASNGLVNNGVAGDDTGNDSTIIIP